MSKTTGKGTSRFYMQAQATSQDQKVAMSGSKPKRPAAPATKPRGRKPVTPVLNARDVIQCSFQQVECLRKSRFFENYKPDKAVISIGHDVIVISGQDDSVVKKVKKKVKTHCDQIKSKYMQIEPSVASLLTKTDTKNYIDHSLDIPNVPVTWEVDLIMQEECLMVYALDSKEADEMCKKIMACVSVKEITIEESKSQWFQDLLQNHGPEINATNIGNTMRIYTTRDFHDKYFISQQTTATNSNCSNKGGMSSKQRRAPDVPGNNGTLKNQSVTATQNQPVTAMQTGATGSSTQKHATDPKVKGVKEEVSKTAEPMPDYEGASGDINSKFSKEIIPLSHGKLKFLERYHSKDIDEICISYDVECETSGDKLILNGEQGSVLNVRKKIDELIKSAMQFRDIALAEIDVSQINVKVERGSILDYDSKVDVIVNSVKSDLDLNNGIVSKKLVQRAGPTIQQECKEKYKGGINIGDIAVTKAGSLKCRYIFHVALYRYWVYDGNISIEILKTLMISCLKEAEKLQLKSIAFPALGTGTLGYPYCLVAKTMFEAVDEYGKTNPSYLKTVLFVLFGDEESGHFENVDGWRKNRTRENFEYDVPPNHLMYVQKDLETRILVSDRDLYRKLSYKEFRVVFTEKGKQEMMLEWDQQDGCYATKMKIAHSEDGLSACFKDIITLMRNKKFHVVDIMLCEMTTGISMQKHLEILIYELKVLAAETNQINKSRGPKVLPEINYVKLVRVFVNAKDYCQFAEECTTQNEQAGCEPLWYISNKVSFPFNVEVVGTKSSIKGVMKKVQQEISAIEDTVEDMALENKEINVDENSADQQLIQASCCHQAGTLRKFPVPSNWIDMDTEYMKIEINPFEGNTVSKEWDTVKMKFEQTFPQAKVISIHRLQNIFLWENFYMRKAKLERTYGKGCANELSLFHGTSPNYLDEIVEQNLDPRLSGLRSQALLGKGTYFAVNASYADTYAHADCNGQKYMFLVRVLAGKKCKGRKEYVRPPKQKPQERNSPLFDSCVDNLENPKIYCVFHDSQYYPEYLISYT